MKPRYGWGNNIKMQGYLGNRIGFILHPSGSG
jgi:hypothetical protein